MAILKAILLGNLSAELKYEIDPADNSFHWGDGADDHWGIVDPGIGKLRDIRFTIELESLSDIEMDRLRILAWDSFNNYPGTP